MGATGVAGLGLLIAAGCPADEPEDGTSTAASSVGNGSATTEVSSSGSSSTGADASSESDGSATGSGSDSGAPAVVYETDVQPIWNAACTCHLMGGSGTMTAPFLTLNPDMSHAQLVGVASEQAASLSRVAPGSPEESYLWLKLTDTHAEVGEGTVMPQTGMLEAEQLERIEAWITQGALP